MTQPIKVNFTSEEAESTVREIPPSGEYTVNITNGVLKEVKPGRKNVGKSYWQLTLVIQEGPYAGASLMSSVMLFDGALYSFAQLMKALDYNLGAGEFFAPELDDIIGKTVNVKGFKMPAKTMPDGQELSERFEIKGYKKANVVKTAASAATSMLP